MSTRRLSQRARWGLESGVATTHPGGARAGGLAAVVAIALSVIAAYGNSFNGPFIFDDVNSIPDNPHIRALWPIAEAMKAPPQETAAGRPILSLSLALTYAVWGLEVAGYHGVNLAIHVLAGLTLFGIVRRTLQAPRLGKRFGGHATVLALAVALLWGLHPLLTGAVTYVIQRAESLAGLFYLLTLYCALRSGQSSRPLAWYAVAVAACALGIGTKEVMVTAPVVVLAYDRVFLSKSFRGIARRWPLYAGLSATWLVLAWLMLSGPRSHSTGFGLEVIGPVDYAKTQCLVVLHYIRLALWPTGQTFDYTGWEIPVGLWDLWIPAATLIGLLTLTVAALALRPAAGLLGLWFFLILAPTSSFVPLSDVAFEHRMYLPLAAIAAGVVLAGYALAKGAVRALGPAGSKAVWTAVACLAVAVAGILGVLTHRRNAVYASAVSIWQDTVNTRPTNHRAHSSLGLAHDARGEHQQALREYGIAIQLRPDDADLYVNRGACLAKLDRYSEALRDFNAALELNAPRLAAYAATGRQIPPNIRRKYAAVYNNRGIIHRQAGRLEMALANYNRALELNPIHVEAIYNRGAAYYYQGDFDGAIAEMDRVIGLDADNAAAYDTRGAAYLQKRQYDKAIADFDTAVRLDPGDSSYSQHRRTAAQEKNKSDKQPATGGT